MNLQNERAYDSEIRYNHEMLRLQQRMQESEIKHNKKVKKQEDMMKKKRLEESTRLNDVLRENKKHNSEKYERDTTRQLVRLKSALGKGVEDDLSSGIKEEIS